MSIPNLETHKKKKAKGDATVFDPGNNRETYAYYESVYDEAGERLPDRVSAIYRSEIVTAIAAKQKELADLNEWLAELDAAKPMPKVK